MKRFFFTALSILTLSTSWGQRKIEYVEYDLPNGLHVILHEEKSTPIVAVSVMYHVGSQNEKPTRTGFAHFFEHLLFEGTTNIERGEYSKIVERNGGTLNANTSTDRTYYYEILPSNQLELGLWLESERLLQAKVDSVGIETQRQVVKEEKRQRMDNQPYGSWMEIMFRNVFKGTNYEWVPIGSMEHLDAAQEEDYVNFYRTYYVPSNAVLSIAGDINIEETKKMINKYFASIPSGEAINLYRDVIGMNDADFKAKYNVARNDFDVKNFANPKSPAAKALLKKLSATKIEINRPSKTEEIKIEAVNETIYDNVQLSAVFVGYKLPSETHKDYQALNLLSEILSGGSSSRMNKNIVEKKQLAMGAYSFPYQMENAGVGIFLAMASQGVTTEQLLTSIDEEIEKLQNELISDEELEKVLNKVENDIASSHNTVANIAENLAQNYLYLGKTELINQELDKFRKVTKEDIQRVAKQYLLKDQRVVLNYLPKQ